MTSTAPPQLEDCSPSGPVARHMVVNVPGAEVFLGKCGVTHVRQCNPNTKNQDGTPGPAAISGNQVDDEVGKSTAGWYPLLRDPADIDVTVTTVTPASEIDSNITATGAQNDQKSSPRPAERAGGGEGRTGEDELRIVGKEQSPLIGNAGDNLSDSGFSRRGKASGAKGEAFEGDDPHISDEEGMTSLDSLFEDEEKEQQQRQKHMEEEGDERAMKVRIKLPRLSLSLTPDARAALAACLGRNILAAGFHGNISENFPLVDVVRFSHGDEENAQGTVSGGERVSMMAAAVDAAGLRRGGGIASAPLVRSPSPPLSSSAYGSSGKGAAASAVACAVCAASFDELLARHRCPCCSHSVCRKCMHTQVCQCIKL